MNSEEMLDLLRMEYSKGRYDRDRLRQLTVDTTPVTRWWQESDGPKADIADVVIRHINTHTHIRSVEEEPAFKELCEKLDLEKVEPDGDNPF